MWNLSASDSPAKSPSALLSSPLSHRGDGPLSTLISSLSDAFFPILSGTTGSAVPPHLCPPCLFYCCVSQPLSSLVHRLPTTPRGHRREAPPGRPVRYKGGRLAGVESLSAGSRRFPGMYFFFPLQWCNNSESSSPPVFVPSPLPALL